MLINEESGARFETHSNEAGSYRFASLLPGNWRVEASATGFESVSRKGLALSVGQVLPIDITLSVGKASETVTITETTPVTETQSSSVAQLVNRKMVSGLPMPNRAATSLVALAPGVVMIDSGQGAENYPVFSIAGGRARNQHFTLDGGNVTNAVGLTRPQQMTSLPMDAMQEFRVISNSYSAEHGHSTGGVITLSTRSGTNQFHGSAFEFLRNSALDARNFFAAEKAPIRMHQFGGSFGGPIRKDKTHFFTTWEQTRQLTSTVTLQTVPDAAQRNGDFSGPEYAASTIPRPPSGARGSRSRATAFRPTDSILSLPRCSDTTLCRIGRPTRAAEITTPRTPIRICIGTSSWRRWTTSFGRKTS